MLKLVYCGVALVGLAALVLVYASTRPARFSIRRQILIAAPPAQVYPLIADLHNWPRWAPQDREDPSMQRAFAGSASGAGAQSSWQSKGSAGSGIMKIQEAVPASLVRVQVDWRRPFKTTNINTFTLTEQGGATLVTWVMEGPNLFPMKVMSVFVNMDRMMGKHFEAGLNQLKSVAEQR